MYFKKIIIAGIIISLSFSLADIGALNDSGDIKMTKIRYRCGVASSDSLKDILGNILFFLLYRENRELLWQEKNGRYKNGSFCEITLFNKKKQVGRFFYQEGTRAAQVDFGGRDISGKFKDEQIKTWFEIRDFVHSAKMGDVYDGFYQTSKSFYRIIIKANKIMFLNIPAGEINTLCFEGKVWKKSEKFMEMKFWIIQDGELKGQVAKCSFKKTSWPAIVLEITN